MLVIICDNEAKCFSLPNEHISERDKYIVLLIVFFN